jgi:hypothetical protein
MGRQPGPVPQRHGQASVTTCNAPAGQDATFTHERLLRLFTSAPNAFWRFDIDVSLDRAVDMARFAQLAGISGVFYVMCRSPLYNPISAPGQRALDDIRSAGHLIGLHVDHQDGNVTRTVDKDRTVALAAGVIAPREWRLISFHMPAAELLWRDFDTFDSAYAAEWQDRYVSDSRREWDDAKQARVSDDMQITLHPEHWFA